MKSAAGARRALMLLAVVLLAATLLMDAAEAHRWRPGRHRGHHHRTPKNLSHVFECCLCGGIDEETDCSTCFDPVRDNPEDTTIDEILTCLSEAEITIDLAAECPFRSGCK
ncbi:uncharacterized protein LOC123518203 [Portunus trituberculatus]|uniref:uncharacterized protein LOC123518203 n=1 Tax=Portunus trituberculatus TaxID=210409 RepID=UPI001E1CFFD1|nr:uncharacterized protein LOC123518203 [Portunus trituberculatus]